MIFKETGREMLTDNFCPKVSIVIPVYNGGNFLANAIECALSQTYDNLEVIVVNDGSTDDGETERVALSYGDRITYYRKENGGVSSALNYGIAKMTGTYFSWLSHDDAYTPTKVADAVAALRSAPDADGRTMAYSWGHYIDGSGNLLKKFPCFLEPGKVYSGSEMVRLILQKGTLNGCCLLIPRQAFDECGGFNEELRFSQDALMWYTFFFHGFRLIFDGKTNVMYRLHGAQTSRNRHDLFEHDAVYIAEKVAPELAKLGGDSNELLYLYARKMAKYDCPLVVRTMRQAAPEGHPFTLLQNVNVDIQLLYSKVRGLVKKIYYRVFLKVKVK